MNRSQFDKHSSIGANSRVLFLVLIGLVLRLDYLVADRSVFDADEAIVGLMAKHIAAGKEIPVFYYGQDYMGSLEAIITSIFFSIFGSSVIALKIVPLLFSLLLICLTYLLGKRVAGERAGFLAALFCAVPPPALLVWSSKARGGFMEIVVLGVLAFLFLCSWLNDDKSSKLKTFGIGALLGFGWWVNNQIIYFMLPIGFLMLVRIGGRIRPLSARVKELLAVSYTGVSGFLIGGLPYWIYNLNRDFVSFKMFQPIEEVDYLGHLSGLIDTALPILLGAKRFWQNADLFSGSSILYGGIAASLLLIVLIVRAHAISRLFVGEVDLEKPFELILLGIFSACSVFVLSAFGYLYAAPRYLLPLYPLLFILLAFGCVVIWERSRLIGVSLAVMIVLGNLVAAYSGGRAMPGQPFVYDQQRVSHDHSELISWLQARDYSAVRTNYWIGYRLAFESDEQVVFKIFQTPRHVRIAEYEERLGRGVDLPLVVVPAQSKLIQRALSVLGVTFKVVTLSGYDVIHSLLPMYEKLIPVDPDHIEAVSNTNAHQAISAVDGKLETRWGSAAPQKSGMEFRLDFKVPTRVVGLRYELASWEHDYPRDLKIELTDSSGTVHKLVGKRDYQAVRYFRDGNPSFFLQHQPFVVRSIKLTQLGKDPVFDWSIAELTPLTLPQG